MKSSKLKQLIKEEILKVISENNPLLNEISADEGSARYENAYEKCWVREWPLNPNGSPVFEISLKQVYTNN